MKIAQIGAAGAALIFICVLGFGLSDFVEPDHNAMKRECDRQNKILSHVGEQVVVGRDTLVIIDVNFWTNTYILNNNQKISFAFITK